MRKDTLDFLVDRTTPVDMLLTVATGLVIRFALPPGSGGRRGGMGLSLWGLGRRNVR